MTRASPCIDISSESTEGFHPAIELPLPRHFSYSSMTNFQGCARRWWYHYIVRAPHEHIGSSLLFGGSIHAALEQVHRIHQLKETVDFESIFTVFEEHWRRASAFRVVKFNKTETEAALFDLADALLRSYIEERLPMFGRITGIEECVRLDVPGLNVPVIGRIDAQIETDVSVVIVDAKTSKTAFKDDKLMQATAQLALYGSAFDPLGRQLGKPVRGRFVVFRKLKQPRIEVVNVDLPSADVNRTLRMLRETWALIEAAYAAGSFPANPSWQCKQCPFRNRCQTETGQNL